MDMNRIQEIMDLERFKTLTPIQKQVIANVHRHKDIIGISSTGSGKSHAFFIPIFATLDFEDPSVQAVISAPTRELAYQLYDRCKKIAKHFNVSVKLITGGMDVKSQSNAQIIIGTPGRMKDLFVEQNILRLDTAKMMIIDEADMTLEFGFLEDVDQILSKMDRHVQTMVFSATIPEGLTPFLKKYLIEPIRIEIEDAQNFESHIQHILVPCKHKSYFEKVADVLEGINPYVCLIFTNTNEEASQCAALLRQKGYDLVELHGNLESRARMQAIKTIQSQKKSYIVASDIASRGIDLEGITHVISCGFPKDLKFYIHRAGRTGRASRDGQCIALYQLSDQKAIDSLMRQGIEFEHKEIKNGQWQDLKPITKRVVHKQDPLAQEISKIVKRKKQKVKPNYKKKQQREIDTLRRRKRRQMIKDDIRRQQKERAIAKAREKWEQE